MEIVKKIIEGEMPPETVTERDPTTRRQKVEKDRLGTKKKFVARSHRFVLMGISE